MHLPHCPLDHGSSNPGLRGQVVQAFCVEGIAFPQLLDEWDYGTGLIHHT